jgi:hypothetical protein
MIRKLPLTIALLFSCTGAMAQGYVGLGVGSIDYDLPGFGNATGFELLAGTEINRNLSFEFSFIDFGESDDGMPPVWRLTGDGITAGALIRAKAGRTADVFFKLGMFSWDIEIKQDGFGTIFMDDGTDIFYGFGVMVKTTDNFSVGARYNIYDADDTDVDVLSIHAQVGF